MSLVLYYFLPIHGHSVALYLLIGLGFLVGIWATGELATSADPDPRRAVWDEFIGMWATCLFVPKTFLWLAAAFCCFRVLDILKPWPIRRLERLPGGLGIMADDLLAGLFGAALLNAARLLVVSHLAVVVLSICHPNGSVILSPLVVFSMDGPDLGPRV